MINGAHFLLYSTNAEADRNFFKDVLELESVDAGHGWLIFALPPSEIGVHPGDGSFVQAEEGQSKLLGTVLYLMCDDIQSTIKSLAAKKVTCSPVNEAEWGSFSLVTLPSGGQIGVYQPKHPTAI